MIRMKIANARPSSSDDGGSNSAKTWPPISICTPLTDGISSSIWLPTSVVSSNDMSWGTSTWA